MFDRPLYFGCKDGPGHFAWLSTGERSQSQLAMFDGALPPIDHTEKEGVARLHHFNGAHGRVCTMLAFWDRSVDKRGASNSLFALPGRLSFSEAIEQSKRYFPWVWKRFTFEVVPEIDPIAELTRLRADLARKWQPMSTAPRDGTEVLIVASQASRYSGQAMLVAHYMPGGHCIEDHPAIDAGWYFESGTMFDKATKPLAWMPLPEYTAALADADTKPQTGG